MEFARIEKLLEAYFEGNTSLAEEMELRSYFTAGEVDHRLESYQPIFMGLQVARDEVSQKEVVLPETRSSNRKVWWYGVAASVAIAIAVAGSVFSEPSLTTQEKEALAAFEDSKKTMLLLSENLNKGAGKLALVDRHFHHTKT